MGNKISQGWPSVIFFDNPGDLANFSVNGLQPGQMAQVRAARVATSGGGFRGAMCRYFLSETLSLAPDNFFVVPTLDNANLQWVHAGIIEQGVIRLTSAEIDLTQVQTVNLFPPLTNYKFTFGQTPFWIITSKDGTITSPPTAQMGCDAGITNIIASTSQTNLAAPALNSNNNVSPVPPTANNLDMSFHPIALEITVGAVLNTATTFKARMAILLAIAGY